MAASDSLIEFYEGTLGGGKTYNAVVTVLECLMRGQPVVTNVELIWAGIDDYCRRRKVVVPKGNIRFVSTEDIKASPDSLINLLVEGSCLFLDELHLIMDSRDWARNAKEGGAFQELLTQMRKVEVDGVFISQSIKNVDAKVVRQITYIKRCRNWSQFPFFGQIIPLPFTLVITSMGVTPNVVSSKRWVWRKKEIYRCYNTKQRFKGFELRGKKAGKVLGRVRSRKTGFGVVLMALGAFGMIIGRYWDDRPTIAERLGAEAGESLPLDGKPPPAAPPAGAQQATAPGHSPPAVSPALPTPAGPEKPARPGLGQRSRLELQLPRYVHAAPFGIVLATGKSLRPGSAFLDGELRSWRVGVDYVTLFLDSNLYPEIRLYRYDTRPILIDDDGASVGLSLGGTDGATGQSVSSVPQLQQSLNAMPQQPASLPMATPAGTPQASGYTAPPPFIPEVSGYRSVAPGPPVAIPAARPH